MVDQRKIYANVLSALETIIDPETGADVIRMRLVLDLKIYEDGTAEYTFRPSSPICPIALPLVMEIIETVKAVDGVRNQKITVVNYSGAEALNKIIASLPLSKF